MAQEFRAEQFFIDERPHNGMTYSEYSKKMATIVKTTNPETLAENEKLLFEYTKLNLQRSRRVEKTFSVDKELLDKIEKISAKQIWMVLTEAWCGDSSQILPAIAKISEVNKNIDLRILERDQNLDIMDKFLTNGKSRSIPKLIIFNNSGKVLSQWGPRPKELVLQIERWKSERIEGEPLKQQIHLWYAKNKNKAITADFTELLTKLI